MNFFSRTSEYLGIRIAMIDALQRYHTALTAQQTDTQKIDSIKAYIAASCQSNRLLGDRGEVVGQAWCAFIDSKPPKAVLAFADDPDVIKILGGISPLKDKADTLSFLDAIRSLSKSANFAFETIAQRNGLIDYRHGETLSSLLAAAETSLNKTSKTAKRPQETAEHAALIRHYFNSPNGPVQDRDLGRKPPRSIGKSATQHQR